MPYLLLIIESTGPRRIRPRDATQARQARMQQFSADLQARGVLIAGHSLASTAQAVRLRVHDGRCTLTDGPFAEVKETPGGFFLLDVPTRQEALAIAATCPAAEWCTIEVRRMGSPHEFVD
ncbi:hypothetical protein C7444_101258 [Sphaerotilus hippei]|uniref:YCII-related domain-containing protein n=1 Tax=Sphaerotilus hippei TaxID=744406 RepID=A0A318H927_9BURK|nr:YciI family protein [Sphaerotilus hippei]PXW99428.1 hypothetical protein C7444_101258 [Sphaerotilus hippei]